ncbi:transcriptional regulator BetI [Roseovarius salis]|uniref:transcriptional regulator BetI n=1 Tax=Roseovarius salis TaxID=3376063 RepID=UPI0037C6BE81
MNKQQPAARARRSSISELRRRELAEAALRTVQKYGLKGTTVHRVSEEAGISQGLVHYHYKTKSDLLEATVKLNYYYLTRQVVLLLRQSDSVGGRLRAVLWGNLCPEVLTRETAHSWASYAGEAAYDPRLARIVKMIERRLMSNLTHELRKLVDRQDAQRIARFLALQLDGIWHHVARLPENPDNHAEYEALCDVLRILLSGLGQGDALDAA